MGRKENTRKQAGPPDKERVRTVANQPWLTNQQEHMLAIGYYTYIYIIYIWLPRLLRDEISSRLLASEWTIVLRLRINGHVQRYLFEGLDGSSTVATLGIIICVYVVP